MPDQLYELELWEFNALVREYSRKLGEESRNSFRTTWNAAALTGAAFVGKLKPLKHYLKEEPSAVGSVLSREQIASFDRRLKEKEERERDGA